MILKLILSELELDLSTYEFSMIEENNWLNDKVSSKYTYPVDIELTPEQNVALGHITEINLAEYDSLLDGQFYAMGLKHDCVFEIEKHIGTQLSGQIRYGLEEFPNFDKELSGLPLEYVELQTSIFDYAKTIIDKTWPEVNFNFPQVITDKIDTDTDQWAFFEGIVNNYVAGDFLINEFDSVNNVQINRNIIQPLPYVLHILQKGFEDAGYSLAGEILEDPEFKKATVYALSEFYYSFSSETQEVQVRLNEPIPGHTQRFAKTITFPEPGRYKIAGNLYLRKNYMSESNAYFKLNNRTVASYRFTKPPNKKYRELYVAVDFNIDFKGTEGPMEFTSLSYNVQNLPGDDSYDALILDVSVTQLSAYDANGNLIPTLVTPNQINLPKCVPNMSFGEFTTAIARWKNYGIVVRDNVVTMDKKVAELQADDTIFNFTEFEVEKPERNFNRGKTFTLEFFKHEHPDYSFPAMYIDNDGYKLSPFIKRDDTDEIIINGLPLPLKPKGDIVTAHGFLDDTSKAFIVLYDGLTGGLNLAQDPASLGLVNIYENNYREWLRFLINSIRTVWSFLTSYERIYQLKVSDIIYAYRQYHIIRKLTRKNTRINVIETEIELETLD